LVALQPGLKVIFTSGADRETVDEFFPYPEKITFLKKPVSINSMVAAIMAACPPAPPPGAAVPKVSKASLSEKFALIGEQWRPKVVAQLNGQELKLVKVQGTFPWHHHAAEDELFLVWRGSLTIEFRDHRVVLGPGEFVVVPRGVEHRTLAEAEAEVLVFEPAATLNTGNVTDAKFTAPNGVVI
jgi:mannose-6-phosphate isomerase-like protein (cupin superfamily)